MVTNFYSIRLLFVSILIFATVLSQAQTPVSNKPDPAKIKVGAVSLIKLNSTPPPYTSGTTVNYVRIREGIKPIDDQGAFDAADYRDVKQTTQYMDGLGRPIQTVTRKATPGDDPKDMVMPLTYDQFGREVYKYLPYVPTTGNNTNDGMIKVNPFGEQNSFYKNVYKDANQNLMYDGEDFLYGRTDYEPSPLNRVQKSMAPGNSWTGSEKGVTQEYLINTPDDAVRIWNIGNVPFEFDHSNPDDAGFIPTTLNTTAGIYTAGELYKNVVIDENGNAVVEYKDKSGQVILKKVQNGTVASDYTGYTNWLCTYYVYDDFNQLRFVIPPKAVEALLATWNLAASPTVINELCFRYEYDSRRRMIGKKVPGAGWTYLLYDQLDRLTFTQDANLRGKNQFLGTIYDQLSRPISTGILTYGSGAAALQAYLNSGVFFSGFILNRHGTITSPSIPVIVTNKRIPGVEYKATESITFEPDFVSEDGANFPVEIIPPVPGESFTETVQVVTAPLPSGYPFVELTGTYYDDYSQIANISSKAYTDNLNNKLSDVGSNQNAEDMLTQSEQSKVSTVGMITGKRVRVLSDPNNLSSGSMLTSVIYYDQKGRPIQIQSENNSGGTDITINRYDFSGKILSNYLVHNNPHSTVPTVKVKTEMVYDHAGRLEETWKTINDEENKRTLIAKNTYDQMGQLLKKELGRKRDAAGSYTNTAMETLDYNYNIRGWLKGINAAYSHPELNSGVSPDRWFGMELNYDWGSEKNITIDRNQYNGNISSTTWKSKGDGVRRAYGFSYDNVNRILGADFSELNGGAYAHSSVDFSMAMGNDTKAAYDANGNIGAMKQMGLKLTGSAAIDKLTYNYYPNTNKLASVSDDVASDSKMGDFNDKNSGDDYGYDLNGNLVTDLNKNIGTLTTATGIKPLSSGAIEYNHLNLPYRITVKDKGTITYTYDAEGNKLEKKVEETFPGKAPIQKTTSYFGGMVYEQNVLQFISHEEGRTRLNAEGSTIVYNNDFFIKDHLGNVRTVLTDEISPVQIYKATMEDDRHQIEVDQFGDKITTRAIGKPVGFEGNSPEENANHYTAYANGSDADTRIGPGIVLKVMAGDKIKANTLAWYNPNGGDNSSQPGLPPLVSALLPLFSNGAIVAGKIVGDIAEFNSANSALTTFLNNQPNSPSPVKAYLNWILLDGETLSLVPGSSGATPVPEIISLENKKALVANNGSDIEITKNGYIYVFVSNESRQNVYFDDLTIQHVRGPLLEETHYYPFGLTMAGISSKELGGMENNKKYNGIEFENDLDLNTYDAFYRELDPQTGRWLQIDPKIGNMDEWSPYASNYDNPIRYSDFLGDEPDDPGPKGIWSAVKEFVNGRIENFKNNTVTEVAWVTGAINQAGQNFNARWDAGVTLPQDIARNPLQYIDGVGEIKMAAVGLGLITEKNLLKIESRALKIEINEVNKIDRELLNPPDKIGNAPTFKSDGTKVEIHHDGQKAQGPFKEMHKEDHRLGDNYKLNHPQGQQPLTKEERKQFDKAREAYWKDQYKKE